MMIQLIRICQIYEMPHFLIVLIYLWYLCLDRSQFNSILTILLGNVIEWEANSFIPSRVLLQDMYLESEPFDPYETWKSTVTTEFGSFAVKPLAGSSSALNNLYKIFLKKPTKIAYYWYVYIYNYLRIFSFIIHNSWVNECKLSFLPKEKI